MIKVSVASAMTILSNLGVKSELYVFLNAYSNAFGYISPNDAPIISKTDLSLVTRFKMLFGESSTFEEALQIVFTKNVE